MWSVSFHAVPGSVLKRGFTVGRGASDPESVELGGGGVVAGGSGFLETKHPFMISMNSSRSSVS